MHRANARPHSRGAMRPRFYHQFRPCRKQGRRESRAPIAPAVVHKKRTSRPQVNRIIRLSLHGGLRLIRDLPGEPCTFATVALRIVDASQARLSRMHLHRTLTPAWGRQDHTISPSAPVPPKLSPDLVPIRRVSSKTVLKRRSSARRMIAHGVQSALRSLARPTLSRPSHPTARS
jgi:hypothetical protein